MKFFFLFYIIGILMLLQVGVRIYVFEDCVFYQVFKEIREVDRLFLAFFLDNFGDISVQILWFQQLKRIVFYIFIQFFSEFFWCFLWLVWVRVKLKLQSLYIYVFRIVQKRRQGQSVSFTDFFGCLVGDIIFKNVSFYIYL